MKEMQHARLMMAASMAIFGTLGPFVRNITVSSGELALYRAILAAALIGAYLLLTKQAIPFRALGRELWLLLLSGAAMGVNWILLFEAYRYTTVFIFYTVRTPFGVSIIINISSSCPSSTFI